MSTWIAAMATAAGLAGCAAPSGRGSAGDRPALDAMAGSANARPSPAAERLRPFHATAPRPVIANAPSGWAPDYVDGTVGTLGCAQ